MGVDGILLGVWQSGVAYVEEPVETQEKPLLRRREPAGTVSSMEGRRELEVVVEVLVGRRRLGAVVEIGVEGVEGDARREQYCWSKATSRLSARNGSAFSLSSLSSFSFSSAFILLSSSSFLLATSLFLSTSFLHSASWARNSATRCLLSSRNSSNAAFESSNLSITSLRTALSSSSFILAALLAL